MRTSLTQTEVIALKKESNQVKLQLEELKEDYKTLQEKYDKDVTRVQQIDEQLKAELRETYEKWNQSKQRVAELQGKLKVVTFSLTLERTQRFL